MKPNYVVLIQQEYIPNVLQLFYHKHLYKYNALREEQLFYHKHLYKYTTTSTYLSSKNKLFTCLTTVNKVL